MICQSCKADLSGTPKFCPICGARIEGASASAPATKRCPQCGTENPLSAKFCKKDGYRLEEIAAAVHAAPQPDPRTEISDVPPTFRSIETRVADVPEAEPVSLQADSANAASADVAICPRCGTANAPTAKFCKKDGVLLWQASSHAEAASERPPPQAPASARAKQAEPAPRVTKAAPLHVTHREEKTSSKGLLVGIAGAVVVVAGGVGGYMYWSGRQAAPQVSAAADNNAAPADVSAPSQASLPTVSLSAPDVAPPQTAISAASPATPAAEAPPAVEQPAQIDVVKIQQELTRQVKNAGFGGVRVSVDSEGGVGLDGTVASKKEKDEVVRLALAQYGVERVNESYLRVLSAAKMPPGTPPQRVAVAPPEPAAQPAAPKQAPDPARLEGEINRALRTGGVGGVTAQVGDDLSVTLKGSTTSAVEKNRAFQIVRRFNGVGTTKDRIFVVEQ